MFTRGNKMLFPALAALAVSLHAAPDPFTINPKTFVLGKAYTITIQASNCGDGHNLKNAKVFATGSGVTIAVPNTVIVHDCDWTGTLTVSQDAEVGGLKIIVQEASVSTSMDVTVSPKALGPIPPGLTPTVDLAWSVLPKRIASDNFGGRVAKLYFPIEVVIGNNSGYDLQLSSVQFQLPAGAGLNNNVPSDSYYTVRSSLQREQLIGARNTTVNIIKAVAPLLTGSTLFFNGSTAAAINHKAFFQSFTNVFNGPFEKGMELLFPDQTVQQLINLDNHTLRDGVVIPNNVQIRSVVFVNKDLLQKSVAAKLSTQPQVGPNTNLSPGKNQAINRYVHEYDQQAVMRELGTLELVGRSISYLNRVSVISNSPGAAPAFTVAPAAVTQDDANIKTVPITLTGDGLSGGTLFASDAALKITDQKVGDAGKTLTATLDASGVAPGKYSLTVRTASGSQSGQFEVKPHDISIDPPSPAISIKAGSPKMTVTLTGKYLKNSQGVPTVDCSGVIVLLQPATDDTKLPVDITAGNSAAATSCTATVKGASGATKSFSFTVTH